MVPNETPQIATADGGVITQSGITYDQNGNATGQINLFTQSWPGYSYQVSSADQIFAKMLAAAKSWWPFQRSNNSGNGTAVEPLWFPKLASCTDSGGNCATLGPGDLIFNAKQALVSRLKMTTCLNQATSQVFKKVAYGGPFGTA